MRLIDVEAFLNFDKGKAGLDAQLLVEFNGPKLAKTAYAILSHCWGEPEDEVQHTEMESLMKMDTAARGKVQRRSGYCKIRESCLQARRNHLRWIWVDTCCIDKRSSAELSEAINSMYVWYANSDCCYAFLHDIDTKTLPTKPDYKNFTDFRGWPKWFSRGWTLQELVAPKDVQSFNRNWEYITSKQDSARKLHDITGISMIVLQKGLTFSYPCVAQIMSWAADRTTTREEDRAYSLLGLFGVHMRMLYGEGKNAFLRLQLEVIRMINDQSIFAWGWTRESGTASAFLANDPSHFRDCSDVVRMSPDKTLVALEKYGFSKHLRPTLSVDESIQAFSVTNHGIKIWLPMKCDSRSGRSEFFAMLACCKGNELSPITITVEQFDRIRSRQFGRSSMAEKRKVPFEYRRVFLPYRDNINLNIRGPSCREGKLAI